MGLHVRNVGCFPHLWLLSLCLMLLLIYGMVQWSPDFEPIFVPMPPGGGSVPTSPEDEQSHSFEFSQPNTSNIQQGTIYLSDDSNTNYGIIDEEMARACQDKFFCKNFKCLAAQEIVKFNPNLEGPKSKNQTNTTIEKHTTHDKFGLRQGKATFGVFKRNNGTYKVPSRVNYQNPPKYI